MVDDCYRLQELASELRGKACRVLDIGAHIGSFTDALPKAVPGAEVTAFEPSADRVAYLAETSLGAAWRTGPRWCRLRLAAG